MLEGVDARVVDETPFGGGVVKPSFEVVDDAGMPGAFGCVSPPFKATKSCPL
jgi:hypothetical protein